MRTVRYVGDWRFEVDGGGRFRDRNEMIFAPLDLVRDVSAVSLREAALRMQRVEEHDEPVVLWLSTDSTAEFDEDLSEVHAAQVVIEDGGLFLQVIVGLSPEDAEAHAALEDALGPLAARCNAEIVGVAADEGWRGVTNLLLRPSYRRRTVGDLVALAENFSALADAFEGRGLNAARSADLVRAGRADLLVGQPESQWLEVKRTAPRIDSEADQFELAKDVAAMANTQDGGLLLYGLRTRGGSAGDRIEALAPFPADLLRPTRIRAVLRHRVHPLPLGMSVEVLPQGDHGAVGAILIPPQRPERKPFLVKGAAVSGRVRSTFISVPTRIGEETVWDDVAGLHALLAAGRAALGG